MSNITIGYWSNYSMIFFLIMSYMFLYVITKQKQLELETKKTVPLWSGPYLFIGLFMVIIASYRLINHGIGGADTPNYIKLFEHCNDKFLQTWDWYLHTDLGFRYFNKFIRLFTSDYHIFFLIVYALNIFAYIGFLNEFLPKRSVFIPCILIVFIYWRGMSSIRSNTAIAVMMISMIMLHRRQKYSCILFGLLSLIIHKVSFVYFLFLPFYYILKKKRHQLIYYTFLLVVIILTIRPLQNYFLLYFNDVDLGGAYTSYASQSLKSSFYDNYWKIAFEQLLLAIALVYFNKPIRKFWVLKDRVDKRRISLIWLMCIFDFVMIPVCFVMGVWRGYEFFYLPRIVMWCEILYVVKRSYYIKNNKSTYPLICLILFSAWLWFRFYNMWESSHLMPYIFEPLYNAL